MHLYTYNSLLMNFIMKTKNITISDIYATKVHIHNSLADILKKTPIKSR